MHPGWAQLAQPENDTLAWRRAACRDPAACAPSEVERGGLLKLLQSEDAPCRLAVPPGTRGALNAYINSTTELAAAVQAQLRVTTDRFYAAEPQLNVNYGGRGASQQLWWCGAKGWKVTQPNRHMLKFMASNPGLAPPAQAKRQRVEDDDATTPDAEEQAIHDSDIGLLPLMDEGTEMPQGGIMPPLDDEELPRGGAAGFLPPSSSSEDGVSTPQTDDGLGSPETDVWSAEGAGASVGDWAELDKEMPPALRFPLAELESSNEFPQMEEGATHERVKAPTVHGGDAAAKTAKAPEPAPEPEPEYAEPTAQAGKKERAKRNGPIATAGLEVVVPPEAAPGQPMQVKVGRQTFKVQLPDDVLVGARYRIDGESRADPTPWPTATTRRRTRREKSGKTRKAGKAGSQLGVGLTQRLSSAEQEREDSAAGGLEAAGVVIATIVGFAGVIFSMAMFRSLNVGGEHLILAAVSLLVAGCLGVKLHRGFRNSQGQRSVSEDEDAMLALVLMLPHVSLGAVVLQLRRTFLSSPDGMGSPGDTVAYEAGSRPLFFAGLLLHLLIGCLEVAFLRGFGRRYRALATETPRGGYLCWLFLTCLPVGLLFVGFAEWETLTCDILDVDSVPANSSALVQGRSPECMSDAAFFSLVNGGILILASVSVAMLSNKGSLAVAWLAMVSLMVLLWAGGLGPGGGQTRAGVWSPLVIMPFVAAWVCGIAVFVPSMSKWSEATTSSLAFSMMFCQMAVAVSDQRWDMFGGPVETSFVAQTGVILWLSQFIFLPAVALGRASFPVLSLVFGSGILPGSAALVALPTAAVVGLLTIKFTTLSTTDEPLFNFAIHGFGIVDDDDAAEKDEEEKERIGQGPDNRNRRAACVCLTPCLSAAYLASSWGTAFQGSTSDVILSATTVFAPVLLGCGHLAMHSWPRLSQFASSDKQELARKVTLCSMGTASLLTAGAWIDESLTAVFTGVFFLPLLLSAQVVYRRSRSPPAAKARGMKIVHGACAVALFFFVALHRLTLHWTQPWLYIAAFYALSWLPLSASVAELRDQPHKPVEGADEPPPSRLRTRLWRPGTLGPLLCTPPAIFWTVLDEKYVCAAEDLLDGTCNENACYQLLLALPMVIVLIEWACDEICVTRYRIAAVCSLATQQRARESALLLLAFSALPFRIWLEVAEESGRSYYYDTRCTLDNSTAAEPVGVLSEWSAAMHAYFNPSPHPEWCDYLPMDVAERKFAAVLFTVVLGSGSLLLMLLCRVLHGESPVHFSSVPPTQLQASAVLALAVLDYWTPVLAAPMGFMSCYMSYVGYRQTQHEGTWPWALLVAIVGWLLKAGTGALLDDEKGRWGVAVFGISPSPELTDFIQHFDHWWAPMMGAVLVVWGIFVRLKVVTKWPEDTEDSEFSWEKLFYLIDAVVFYGAVFLMSDLSDGWIGVIGCFTVPVWGIYMRDVTMVLRLPMLFIATFMNLEWWMDAEFGSFCFFAAAVCCIVSSFVTKVFFEADDRSYSAGAGLVDLTVLWGYLSALADGPAGVSQGGLGLALGVLSLPWLHFRGYPMLVVAPPLMTPLSLLALLTNLDVGGDGMERVAISSLLGCAYGILLIVLSVVRISPTRAGDSSDFTVVFGSAAWLVTKQTYHAWLLWFGTSWIFFWTVFGLYWTGISIGGALAVMMLIGALNVTMGFRDRQTVRRSVHFRLTGLAELCIAIWLGAIWPGVGDFLQAILMLVGSFFALGCAGIWLNWMRGLNFDTMRPSLAIVDDSFVVANPMVDDSRARQMAERRKATAGEPKGRTLNPLMATTTDGDASSTPAPGNARNNSALRAAERAYLGALMKSEGVTPRPFSKAQAAIIGERLAAASWAILLDVTEPPRTMTVETERLNVRQAPSTDATILRKLPRGARVEVVGTHESGGRQWLELGQREALASEQYVGGVGWVLGSGSNGRRFLR